MKAGHSIVIDSGMVDCMYGSAERFEQEGQVAVAGAHIENRPVPHQSRQLPIFPFEQLVEHRYVGKRRVRIPARLYRVLMPQLDLFGLASKLLRSGHKLMNVRYSHACDDTETN